MRWNVTQRGPCKRRSEEDEEEKEEEEEEEEEQTGEMEGSIYDRLIC